MDAILNPLYTAVSWVLVTFHDLLAFTNNKDLQWSVGIIALVILIRIILIPLFVKQIKSQRALTALAPHMKEIQKKYKDDRQKQSEEMMKLYREHKTNPLASCFPILAQAPIFFALFWVLNSISQNQGRGLMKGEYLASAREASFFGAPLSGTFLGSSDATTKIVTIVLIIFMSATTFTTQRQLMVKGMPKMDSSNNIMLQQQKVMLYLFPIIFAVTGVNFPIGVLIYWSTTNLWTWGQQYYVIKRNPTPGSPAYEELQKKKAAKGLIDDKQNQEGGSTIVENQPTGQRKQPKRKKKEALVKSVQKLSNYTIGINNTLEAKMSEATEEKVKDKKSLIAQLEEEGDVAADYLEGLLDIADLDGDIDIDVENDRAALAIAGGKLNHLVGGRGEVLDALQELTRLAVQTSLGERSRLMLDIDNFRSDKKAELAQLAKETAKEVKSTGEAIKLRPMNAFERKVVHDTIQEIGLTSESEGEDPDRCVVVLPE